MTDEQKKQMCNACPIPTACEKAGYCVRNGLLTMPRHMGMNLVNQTYNELKAILKLGGDAE